MKLVDRYILRTLAVPLVYCFAAFVILIIIHDLFDNVPDFIEAKTPILEILRFYLFLMPSVLVLIMPICLLLGVLYCLSQLTKNNELTALRASGVSLYRLMLPIALTGLAASLMVAFVHETLAPASAHWTEQFLRYQKHLKDGEKISIHLVRDPLYIHEIRNREWHIKELDTDQMVMQNVTVRQYNDEKRLLSIMQAERAQWLDHRWWFTGVAIQEYDEQGDPVQQFDANGIASSTRYERELELAEFSETPRDFMSSLKDPAFLSSRDLRAFVMTHPELPKERRAQYMVDMHSRLAMPWMCFIVTLLGIPFGAHTARKGAIAGVILSLSLFFGFYVLINLCLWLGKSLYIEPWIAGWFPNLSFLAIGLVTIYRMR